MLVDVLPVALVRRTERFVIQGVILFLVRDVFFASAPLQRQMQFGGAPRCCLEESASFLLLLLLVVLTRQTGIEAEKGIHHWALALHPYERSRRATQITVFHPAPPPHHTAKLVRAFGFGVETAQQPRHCYG